MTLHVHGASRATVTAIALALAGSAALFAQQPPATAERRFEAASVKPGLSPSELGRQMAQAGGARGGPVFFGVRTMPGGRFLASTVTLKQLIARAFDVKDYQIDGGPAWMASDYFEIAATAGSDATPAEFNEMLRALLVERFGLRTHTETRDAQVHVVTLARNDGRLGPGLKPTSPECEKQMAEKTPPSRPAGPPANVPVCGLQTMMGRPTGATLTMGGMEISSLIAHLSGELSAHVIDRTGLTGRFDITLEHVSRRMGNTGLSAEPAAIESFPPIPEALQRQLGLRIEQQTGPLPFVVVDDATHPMPD